MDEFIENAQHRSRRNIQDPDSYLFGHYIVISVMNHKGGCSKTALCNALAHMFAKLGLSVLLVDNDSQRNLTQGLGLLDDDAFTEHRMNVFYQNMDRRSFTEKQINMPINITSDYLSKCPGIVDLIPGHNNSDIDAAAVVGKLSLRGGKKTFRDRIHFYGSYYDVIIIDTAPAAHDSASNQFTAAAAQEIIIPFDGSEAIHGLDVFINWLIECCDDELPNGMFVLSKYQCDTKDVRYKLKSILELDTQLDIRTTGTNCSSDFKVMKNVFGNHVCNTGIPERRVLRHHTFDGLKVYSDILKLYKALCEEIIQKLLDPKRANLFKMWQEENLSQELKLLMAPLEHCRHNSESHVFEPVMFDDITKAKSDFGLK